VLVPTIGDNPNDVSDTTDEAGVPPPPPEAAIVISSLSPTMASVNVTFVPGLINATRAPVTPVAVLSRCTGTRMG
jgi:hypothetical protein